MLQSLTAKMKFFRFCLVVGVLGAVIAGTTAAEHVHATHGTQDFEHDCEVCITGFSYTTLLASGVSFLLGSFPTGDVVSGAQETPTVVSLTILSARAPPASA